MSSKEEPKQPPLHARLFWYQWEDRDEMGLVRAMLEHCWDGSVIWASISRLSAYSKIPDTKIKALIHGREARGKHLAIRGLEERKVLTTIAPHNAKKNRPATYRFNEWALKPDPIMAKYLREENQLTLPGIKLTPVPGQPIPRPEATPGANFAGGGNHSATLGRTSPEGNQFDTLGRTSPGGRVQLSLQVPATPLNQGLEAPPGANFAGGGINLDTLGRTSPEPGANFAPDYLQPRSKTKPTSSSTVSECEEISDALASHGITIDQEAMERLVTDCREATPDATTAEIVHFVHEKCVAMERMPRKRTGDFTTTSKIDNPTGFLLRSVPKCFEGTAFTAWRKRAAQRAAAANSSAPNSSVTNSSAPNSSVTSQWATCDFCGKSFPKLGLRHCPHCRHELAPEPGAN